jgi:hypothetical protein
MGWLATFNIFFLFFFLKKKNYFFYNFFILHGSKSMGIIRDTPPHKIRDKCQHLKRVDVDCVLLKKLLESRRKYQLNFFIKDKYYLWHFLKSKQFFYSGCCPYLFIFMFYNIVHGRSWIIYSPWSKQYSMIFI